MGKISNDVFNQIMSMLDDLENRVMQLNNDFIQVTAKRNVGTIRKVADKAEQKVVSMAKEKRKIYTDKRRELANKVSEMARTANKRLDRLEKNNLQNLSAYKAWADDGKIRFSVKGKSYQQLQREYWRVKNFLDAQTSTIKGAKANMQKIARDIIGLQSEKVNKMSIDDLKNTTANFFKIKEDIEKKFKDMGETAKSMDYQKIMNEIANYFENDYSNLTGLTGDATEISRTADAIMQYMEMEQDITDDIIGW